MNQVFAIALAQAPGNAFSAFSVAALVLVFVIALFAAVAYSAKHVRFDLAPEGLRIRGDMYGRLVPAESLVPSEAREINLDGDSPYELAVRTNGIGLPGYKSGWFRLSNGEKALVFLTDTSRVVYIPTMEGYSLLLSPGDPAAFIAGLRTNSSATYPAASK
jgi:hypothetical protein